MERVQDPVVGGQSAAADHHGGEMTDRPGTDDGRGLTDDRPGANDDGPDAIDHRPGAIDDRPDDAAERSAALEPDAMLTADELPASGGGIAREDEPPERAPLPIDAPTSRTAARLAHIHLAVGMHGLARAELETLAARGALDVPALADLAEVRWRTGDLVGAGEAADACLQAGGDALVVLCIAAEAASAAGRAADARQLAARVLARGRDRLDELFAGQPRGPIWPPSRESAPAAVPAAAMSVPEPATSDMTPTVTMSGSLAEIQARVARADLAGTATRLGLVLRTRPALAPAVLAVADEAIHADPAGAEVAGLHLVRGDAYRLMGRETLAAEAFQHSSRSLRLRPAAPSERSGPAESAAAAEEES